MSTIGISEARPPTTPPHRCVEEVINKSTPIRQNSSSTRVAPHIRLTIDPLVENEMKEYTQNAQVAKWVNAICGVDNDTINTWAAYFKSKKLFEVVSKDLDVFCDARLETDRYRPLANIFTTILEIARDSGEKMSGLENTPPLDDLRFVPHDSKVMRRQEHQGKLAAIRKPDIVVARKRDVENARAMGKGLEWSAAVIAFELKQENILRPQLNAVRESRGLGNSTSRAEDGALIPVSEVRVVMTISALLHRS